jgi:hypothetical protein
VGIPAKVRAVELGREDAIALSMGGVALALVVGDVEDGAAFIDEALVLASEFGCGMDFMVMSESFWANPM